MQADVSGLPMRSFHDLNPGNGTETTQCFSERCKTASLSTTLIPATGLKLRKQVENIKDFGSFHDLNPGNGTETTLLS